MSLETEVARLLEAIEAAPGDLAAWEALGRWCARTGAPPPGIRPEDLGPALQECWRRHPEDRRLVPALLGLLDAELVHPDPAPPRYWGEGLRQAEDHAFDAHSGLPLLIRRRRDQAWMRLVPWAYVVLGRDGRRSLPRRSEAVGPFYVDVRPVTLAQLAEFRGTAGGPGDLPALVEYDEARAFAIARRGELMLEPEWGRLRTKAEALESAPEFSGPWLDAEERREIRQAWHQRNAPMLAQDCAFGVEAAPLPEWTCSDAAWFEGRVGVSLGGEGARLVVRGPGHLGAAPRRGAVHAFRVVYPLGSRAERPAPPARVG